MPRYGLCRVKPCQLPEDPCEDYLARGKLLDVVVVPLPAGLNNTYVGLELHTHGIFWASALVPALVGTPPWPCLEPVPLVFAFVSFQNKCVHNYFVRPENGVTYIHIYIYIYDGRNRAEETKFSQHQLIESMSTNRTNRTHRTNQTNQTN